jgi:hypothetical protein
VPPGGWGVRGDGDQPQHDLPQELPELVVQPPSPFPRSRSATHKTHNVRDQEAVDQRE